MIRFLLIFILSFFENFGLSQDPYHVLITTENGLPSNTIYDIFQDKKGFIWIASEAGLSRYDGFEFITYTTENQSSRSGSNIREDKYGRIWYQNFDGFLFYLENGELKRMPSHHPIGYNPIGIIEDKLFAVENQGVIIYDLKTFRRLSTIPINYIINTEQTESHFYVLGSPYFKIDKNGKFIKLNIPKNTDLHELPGLMLRGKQNKWLISRTNRKKKCFQLTNKGVLPVFDLSIDAFIQNCSYTPSSLWMCTPKGVYRYSEEHPEKHTHYFPQKNVSCVIQDREGNYWIGTQNDGIILIPDIDRKLLFPGIHPYKISIVNNNVFLGSSDDRIYQLNFDQQTASLLHFGTSNHTIGQLRYDPLTKCVFFTSNIFGCIQTNGKKQFNLDLAAKDYRFLDRGYIAIAASGSCNIYQLNNYTKSDWHIPYQANKLLVNGTYYWNLIKNVRAKSVEYLPNEHRLYFATNIGLFETTGKSRKLILFKGKNIYCSKLARHRQHIYALTSGGKIIRFDKRNNMESLSDKLQLNSELIQQMEVVNDKLLFCSPTWIYVYDFHKKHPLVGKFATHSQEITDLSLWKNQLVIVTKKGIILQPLSVLPFGRSKSTFVINSLKVNQKPLSITTSHDLSHDQNNIEINYSILSFSNGGNVPLRYRINLQEWEQAPHTTRTLKLASLSPDNYTITFKLGNSEQLHRVQFVIHPAWYATTWFLTTSIAVGFFIFFFYFRGRIRSLQKRNTLLSQKVELEESLTRSMLTSIKSQMNPHFFYNALNTIQSFIFTDDKKNASIYLFKFSKLTRIILEMSDKETIRLAEEIDALTLYLDIEKVRFDTDFEFTIEVEKAFSIDLINIPSMIIQPYVENAMKHGLLHKKGEKRLAIRFSKTDTHLVVCVDDNGIGRKHSNELKMNKTPQHQSFATSANQKRLELLNRGRNTLVSVQYIDKPLGSGTTVIIRIPIAI